MTTTIATGPASEREPGFMSSLLSRRLVRYPDSTMRYFQLGVIMVLTVGFYYENYVQGTVAAQILAHYHMSFIYFLTGSAIVQLVGACGSILAGLGDRLGRANMVVYGYGITVVFIGLVIPHAGSKLVYMLEFGVVGLIEGMALVAAPALARDYSPQVRRGLAMALITMGPVAGSLLTTLIANNTLSASNPQWRQQFTICGVVGAGVFVVAFLTVRELSPKLRDQVMVTLEERTLVEARARGIDVSTAPEKPFRQVMRLDVVGSAIAVSLYLILTYTLLGFGSLIFETLWGFTAPNANGVLNWAWAANTITLVVIGWGSDRLGVRKPFILVGAIGALVMMGVFISQLHHPHESYYGLATIFAILFGFVGLTYAPWMAAFTETVEGVNPALMAPGLAVWAWLLRLTVAASFLIVPHIVTAVTPLTNYGPQAAIYEKQFAPELATAQAVGTPLLNQLKEHPTDAAVLAQVQQRLGSDAIPRLLALQKASSQPGFQFLEQHGPALAQAQSEQRGQWEIWFWVCFGGIAAYLVAPFLLKGRWNPVTARRDREEHERLVELELSALEAPTAEGAR